MPGLVARPRLLDRLDAAAEGPVTLVCAPAGSGKSTLIASWLSQDPDRAVAWVEVERDETDATRFWSAVLDSVRATDTPAADDPLTTLLPPPDGDRAEFLTRLTAGLGRLPRPLHLVLDDLHHLRSEAALAELEQLLARPPEHLRTIILARREPKIGLHRLRLTGSVTELRADDLAFTAHETAALLQAAGLAVGQEHADRICERTEGWAAGLRLAALSLERHQDLDRFLAEFSGSERTVADYLLGEVLASQPPEVRALLLRTCVVDRVNGELADVLTGRTDSARLLHELEEANALVVAVDVGRTWFRYHHLLTDLLRLELRRHDPAAVPELHRAAARWHARHGDPIDAIRQALLGADVDLAVELLARHWVSLVLAGEEATLGALLAHLPADLGESDAEVAAIAAADRLWQSRWADADRLLALAGERLGALPEPRRHRAELALATVELLRARRLGDPGGATDQAVAVLEGAADAGDDLQALAFMNLGIAESWSVRFADAEQHLHRALAVSRRIGRPVVECTCLGALGTVLQMTMRPIEAEARLREATEIAERAGWTTHPLVGATYVNLAVVLATRGAFAEAEHWNDRAGPLLAGAREPVAGMAVAHVQGMLAIARGDDATAAEAFADGRRRAQELRAPHFLAELERQWELRARLRAGDAAPARAALATPEPGAQWHNLVARVRLTDDDAQGAVDAVAPVLAGEAPALHANILIEARLLDALARDRLGEREAAFASVEGALALAEPHGHVWIVLTVPGADELLRRHPVHRTAHAAHLKHLLDHLAGVQPERGAAAEPTEALSERELAVLRFLPTNLSAAEIGSELFLSVHTVKTHMRKLYAKLDVHTRAEAVERARALGLLAPGRDVTRIVR